MIIGIGSDLIDIHRIDSLLCRFGPRFKNRLFTRQEQERCETSSHPAASYAKRFAAKEAFLKAIGLGFSDHVQWREIEVHNAPSGQPYILLHGLASTLLAKKNSSRSQPEIHLTLSDTADLAQAFVVIYCPFQGI